MTSEEVTDDDSNDAARNREESSPGGDSSRDGDYLRPDTSDPVREVERANQPNQRGEIGLGGHGEPDSPSLESEQIPPELIKFITREIIVEATQHFSGPIPPASELAKYKQISPDLVDRIMAMSEKNQEAHAKALEKTVASESRSIALVSAAYTLAIPIFAVVMIVGIIVGSDTAAISGACAAIAALAPAIIKAVKGDSDKSEE
ncbi:MAG: DUF2335 domain-containing protein [Mobiluncus sp.]|uniref:DUF2335 domain-containing protein n=1 Tax=Mobiluncus sp. TaxID=47293 RepID=UPI002588DDEE|nr:DUF2335 domain-containing protein [Mobiluncus sp.]MCI6584062.1 DUF2335 domain-containing protein [Mobiluncus sp.]